MQKALSHRYSFPPPSHRFSRQQDNLIASPPSLVFDSGGDINAANMVDGMNTPTVAAGATLGVDPGTTSRTTPSSRSSEIEQVLPSDPRLVSAIVSPPPSSSSTADRPQHFQQQQQQQQQQKRREPFISPLTEANLKFHTNSHPNTKEARKFYVDSYVETQANVIQLETKLQRRRRAEIRSLVPLDTLSLSDEVIMQQPVTQSIVENLTTEADNTTNNNNNSNANNNNNADISNNKKKQRKWFPRWLTSILFKRKQEELQEKHYQQGLGQHQHVSLVIAATGKEGRTTINNDVVIQQSLQQQRYSSTSPIKSSTITPTTTAPPVSTPSHLQRNSWASPETSYQQYQSEKFELLHEGLCGLNNINILRALGAHNRAVTGNGRRAGTTTSMIILSSQPQLQQQLRQQDIKQDSGVSFITQQQQAKNSNKSRHRFSARLRSVREQDEQQQEQQQNQLSNTSTLIGFRYPRMVHRQTLRDAAIHVLSSGLSFYEDEDYFNDNDYVDEMDVDHHDQGTNIYSREQRQEYIRGRGRGRLATLDKQNYILTRQQPCYQPRNKRFSDPGLMLYSQ